MVSQTTPAKLAPSPLPYYEGKKIINKVYDFARRVFSSPTFLTFLLTASMVTLTAFCFHMHINPVYIASSIAINTAMLGFVIITKRKYLFYENNLLYDYFQEKFNKNIHWYDKITENIFLGAIPIKEKDHVKALKKEKINSVLTILEDFEIYRQTILTTPITPNQWKESKVKQKIISAKDAHPLSIDQIEEGVKFLIDEVKNKNRVYVHCKSGVGRSATVVACYLMNKDRNLTVDKAIALVKTKRSNIKLWQRRKILQKYYDKIHSKNTDSSQNSIYQRFLSLVR